MTEVDLNPTWWNKRQGQCEAEVILPAEEILEKLTDESCSLYIAAKINSIKNAPEGQSKKNGVNV